MAEDIARVSSDGEPHELLTIVAVSSGALVAIIILIILRINLKVTNKSSHKNEKRRFSLFNVRRSLDISGKHYPEAQIYTIESLPTDKKIPIDEFPESDKFLYIPSITTISM
ncbi:hypothetical protein DMENIID0001_169840 [Sergentomyia squamirostris]